VFCGNWPSSTVPIWCNQRVPNPETSNSHAIQWTSPVFITKPLRVTPLMRVLVLPPSEVSQPPRKDSERLSLLLKQRTQANSSAKPKPSPRVAPRLPSTSSPSTTWMRRRRHFSSRDSVDWTTLSTRNNEHDAATRQDICEIGALPFPQRYASIPH